MRRHRRELRACGEQGGEVIHRVDLELGQYPIEKARVGDRAGELALHLARQRGRQRVEIDGDNRVAPALDELINQSVADFSAGARDEHH